MTGRKWIAALLIAWLSGSLAPGAARAAEGLYLGWGECRSGSGGADLPFGCDSNDLSFDLFCSFQPPANFSDEVIGVEVVVDVQHASPVLPDWWQMGSSGCRAGQLLANADFSSHSDCVDPWAGPESAEVQGFDIGQPRGGANQVRIRAVAGVLPKAAVSLLSTEIYYGLKIRFFTGGTTGSGSCGGCLAPACLVLNGIVIRTLADPPEGPVTIVTPGFAGSNFATWRGGAGADCNVVPARRSSWGQIKALYR